MYEFEAARILTNDQIRNRLNYKLRARGEKIKQLTWWSWAVVSLDEREVKGVQQSLLNTPAELVKFFRCMKPSDYLCHYVDTGTRITTLRKVYSFPDTRFAFKLEPEVTELVHAVEKAGLLQYSKTDDQYAYIGSCAELSFWVKGVDKLVLLITKGEGLGTLKRDWKDARTLLLDEWKERLKPTPMLVEEVSAAV